MRNVPIFKKLDRLFLKHYVGQQNMPVGCQFVTFVLKHNHCSLTVSFCLSFANLFFFLPDHCWGLRCNKLPSLRLATQWPSVCPLSLTQLWPSTLSPCWEFSYCCPPTILWWVPFPRDQRHPRKSFLQFCLTWISVHQHPPGPSRLRGESAQPVFMGILNALIQPLVTGNQVCHHWEMLSRSSIVFTQHWLGSPWDPFRQLREMSTVIT